MKEKISQNKIIPYVIILIIAIIISLPMFSKNLNLAIDDGIQHICRLIENYKEITNGNMYPEIFSNLCNNFGYSWNIFYSPITSFVPLIFKLFTNSFITTLKIFLFITLFLSGIFMYRFLKELIKNKNISIIGAVLYMLAPYHLTDMYLRVAIAEFTSFVFIPLTFLGLYNIIKEDGKKYFSLIFGATGLILTHTVITLITASFCIIYVLINIKQLKEKNKIIKIIISLIFILGITAFFTLPLLELKNATTYEVFVKDRMGTVESYNNSKIEILRLLWSGNEVLCFELGLVTIIGLFLTPIAIKKIDDKYKKEYIVFLIFGILSTVLTLKIFPINIFGNFASMIQFAWRFLEFTSFFLSIIVAINFGTCIVGFKITDVLIISIVIILSLFGVILRLNFEMPVSEEYLLETVRVTENTGRVHAGCASFEYLPQKAFQNLDYIKSREDKIYIIEGKAIIANYNKDSKKLIATIKTEGNTKLELPYIYYPGYSVTLKTQNCNQELDIYETENGFIGIDIEQGVDVNIEVKYTGTALMNISRIISIISFISCICFVKLKKFSK